MHGPEQWLTPADVGRLFGRSAQWARNQARNERLPCTIIGIGSVRSEYRFPRAAIMRLVELEPGRGDRRAHPDNGLRIALELTESRVRDLELELAIIKTRCAGHLETIARLEAERERMAAALRSLVPTTRTEPHP